MTSQPLILALSSHKGGSGQTTLASALSWYWKEEGHEVTLIDHKEFSHLELLTETQENSPSLEKKTLPHQWNKRGRIYIVDCPLVSEESSQRILAEAHGVVLCSRPDPLSLGTLPAALDSIKRATEERGTFLGMVLNQLNKKSDIQKKTVRELSQNHSSLFLGRPFSHNKKLAQWGGARGGDFPLGRGRKELALLAKEIFERMEGKGPRKANSAAMTRGELLVWVLFLNSVVYFVAALIYLVLYFTLLK